MRPCVRARGVANRRPVLAGRRFRFGVTKRGRRAISRLQIAAGFLLGTTMLPGMLVAAELPSDTTLTPPDLSQPEPAPPERAEVTYRQLIGQEYLNYCGEILEAAPDPTFTYTEKREIRTGTSPSYYHPDESVDCSREFRYDPEIAYPSVGIAYKFDINVFKRFAAAVLPAYDLLLEPHWERRWTTIEGLNLEKTSHWEMTEQHALYTLRQPRPEHQVVLQVSLSQSKFTVRIRVYAPTASVPPQEFEKPERYN